MRIALTANTKASVKKRLANDAPPDALAEYDASETVEGILGVLRSAGHDAFLLEADETLLDTLREQHPDFCFNIAEGLRGDAREAQVPALLEFLGIPYTGSKVLTNAISLDKAATKIIWQSYGLPTAPFQVFIQATDPLKPELRFPLFVKPVREGSGMGINERSIVHDEQALREQVAWVLRTYRQPALVETYLPGREFTVGLVGNRLHEGSRRRPGFYDARGYHVFPVEEIDVSRGELKGVYNTFAKSYAPDDPGAPGLICPADIPETLALEMQELTIAAFEALGALDVSRVDFRLDAEGRPMLVEINTLPGLRPGFSDLWIVADAEGVTYETLVLEILHLALERYGMA